MQILTLLLTYGRDVLEAVQMSVNPKVIETPFITGVAMNGIEVKRNVL